MRNKIQFPVTTDEIVEILNEVRREIARDSRGIGDPRCWVIDEAISRIKDGETFKVVRTDDNGHVFTVRSGMNFNDATALLDLMCGRGHKQVYSIDRD